MNNEMCGYNGTCGTEEKPSTAKGIVKINYKEDFELVVELLAGDKPYKLGEEDFSIDFIVMASHYTVGRTAGVCERCSVDGNKIRCFMDSHGLPPGELRAEVKVNTPDPNYADGSRLNVAIAEGMVVLVKDNTRFDGAVVKANIPVALVDAYQLAKAHGYKGTIDEYYATFNEIGHLKENIKGTLDEMTEAEKQRANAETERAQAETERQKNRDRFNAAETERVKNEQQRNATETERVAAEKQRNDTEQARKKDEQQRQTNEDARQKAENERATAERKRETDTQDAIERVNDRMKKLRDGSDGKSAYDIWKAQGNSGTEADFVSSLGNAMKIVTHEETETAVTLRPFEEHHWKGNPKTLDITMEKPKQGELAAEYRMCVQVGAEKMQNVAFPANCHFVLTPLFGPNTYYEISMVYDNNTDMYHAVFGEYNAKG